MVWTPGTFTVQLRDYSTTKSAPCEVRGLVSPPWGIYHGNPYQVGAAGFTVVHLPTGIFYITLARRKHCQALLKELMALRISWDESDPQKVTGPDAHRARAIVEFYLEVT